MLSALKWTLKNQNVATTIPSMTDMDQLDENLKAMAQPFGGTDEKLLASKLSLISPLYCRLCGSAKVLALKACTFRIRSDSLPTPTAMANSH